MTYQTLDCLKCKYYESYHQYPNPNSVARHYCKKCDDEIRYVRESCNSDFYVVWYPKKCYFNNYFDPIPEEPVVCEDYGLHCQIED